MTGPGSSVHAKIKVLEGRLEALKSNAEKRDSIERELAALRKGNGRRKSD